MPDRGSGVGNITEASTHSERRMNENETKDKATDSSVDKTSQNIRVCLRFRPMNKLEKSRRSRDCVEFHPPGIYGSTELTIDSPLEGEYDFNFDQVFEGDASQSTVYRHAGAPLAKTLIEGRNCALILYGQSGSGKTYTMIGDQNAKNRIKSDTNEVESQNAMPEGIDEKAGIIPRITKDIFNEMDKSSASIEFTVRASYIEIYLEQIRDLLNPSSQFLKIVDSPSPLTSHRLMQNGKNKKAKHETVHINNLSELCCIDSNDVISLLARGNAYRRSSEQKNVTDPRHAHTIFILKIEQRDTITKNEIVSMLQLVDMAGSESDGKGQKKGMKKGKPGSAVHQLETKIINRAHSALDNVLRALTDTNKHKHNSNNRSHLRVLQKKVPYRESKLTTILKDAFGGNCLTAFVLSASPASYNISATIATLRLGQKLRRIQNNPIINMVSNPEELSTELEKLKKRESELLWIVETIGVECQRFKAETKKNQSTVKSSSDEVIDNLGKILNGHQHLFVKNGNIPNLNLNPNDSRTIRNNSLREDLMKKEDKIASLERQLDETKKARDRVHNLMLEIQAECAVLRTESDAVLAAKKKNTFDLIDAQNEIQDLCQSKLEVEHNLRTSQFREHEATTFLRHFRRFYKKLLQSQATQGSGHIQNVISSVPGVPNMKDMVGIDTFLAASGLIEMEEVDNDDISESYQPSVPALLRSSSGAKQAQYVEAELAKIGKEQSQGKNKKTLPRSNTGESHNTHNTNNTTSTKSSSGNMSSSRDATSESKVSNCKKSARFHEAIETRTDNDHSSLVSNATPKMSTNNSAKNHTAKQMELHTPAGIATKIRQEQLEDDLSRMSRICIELQIALNEERELNEILSRKQGARAKRRAAEEAMSMKKELMKKTHDLQAVIWKMNELHLINKTYDEKLSSREQHVTYLEESLAALNQRGVEVAAIHRKSERKSRDEIEQLQSLLSSMTKPIWQYGEKGVNRSLESRMMIPIQGGNRDIAVDNSSHQSGQNEVEEEDMRPRSRPLDASNASSQITTPSIDLRTETPPSHSLFGGRNKYTDHSEAGLSYSTPGHSSIDLDTESNMSENITIRAGTIDGAISLDPLVEEMTRRTGNRISDERSIESKMMKENAGSLGQTPPKSVPFGGHTNSFIPRRFNKKYGPLVKPGVLKPNSIERRQSENFFRGGLSRGSTTSSLTSAPEIKAGFIPVQS